MAQSDILKRYLDAGMAFTQLTRARADAIVKELVRAGEVRRERTQETVDDLVERSRRNTEALLGLVRKEVTSQLSQLGLATKEDLARLERRLGGTTKGAAKKKAPAKKAAAKKAPGSSRGPGSSGGSGAAFGPAGGPPTAGERLPGPAGI